MLKRIFSALVLAVAVLLVSVNQPVRAQNPVESAWQATYWNNIDLAGPPVLQRSEANIDYDWGSGSPASEIEPNGFSARWTQTIALERGLYRFTATSDDGIRVWVDNALIIDEWVPRPVQTVSVVRDLRGGSHRITVEYFDDTGDAMVQLAWNPVASEDNRPVWKAEYFDNASLSGQPQLVRQDPQINFNWGADSPAPGQLGFDNFSVRWSRLIDLPVGLYRFTMTVDDGARLWVNDQLLIDAWQQQAPTQFVEDIYLPGGLIPMQMEYFEQTGGAVARLEWEPVSATTTTWRGEYFDNLTLSGVPALVREEPELDFDWGNGAPVAGSAFGLGPNRFSARWQRTLNLPADTYRFAMTVDDGGRLWVNGRLLIDAWQVQATNTHTAEIELPGGETTVKMEYFENTGQAVASLDWRPVSEPVVLQDWRGDYYNNPSLSGNPVSVRYDEHINFNWGNESPELLTIDRDNFSVRWRKTVNLPAGLYCFIMTVDDGGRLLVNSRPLLDVWTVQPATSYVRKINLPAGATSITMEYFENTGQAGAQLVWGQVNPAATSAAGYIDDRPAGFVPNDFEVTQQVQQICRQEPAVAVVSARR